MSPEPAEGETLRLLIAELDIACAVMEPDDDPGGPTGREQENP